MEKEKGAGTVPCIKAPGLTHTLYPHVLWTFGEVDQ